MGPTLMGGATALSVGISYVLIPAIQLSIALEMTDHISEKPILGKFAELLRQCISWGMKGAAMLFMLLLSLQKIIRIQVSFILSNNKRNSYLT